MLYKFLLFSVFCSCILPGYTQNTHITSKPVVGANWSYRNDVGWGIERVKSTPESLIVLFSVDKQSLSVTPKTLQGMSRLMCLCPYDEDFQQALSESQSSYAAAGLSAESWWSDVRNLENMKSMSWVTDMREPTIAYGGYGYYDDFGRKYSVTDRTLPRPVYIEVTFPPLPPGTEKFSIVDYGMRNRFLDIEIKNPYLTGVQTEWSESRLREEWETNGFDRFEGIFDMLSYPNYKLGLKAKHSGLYDLVYLQSSEPKGWKSGELKAEVVPSATPGLFKANWIMSNKIDRADVLISVDMGKMEVVFLDEELLFLKMFPTSDMSNSNSQRNAISGEGGLVGSGSAVVVDAKHGYLVTNYHVAAAGKEIRAIIEGSEYSLVVSATDESNDLALLRISGNVPAGLKALAISINDALGDAIVTAGYPLQDVLGSDIKVTEGIISSTSYLGSSNMYQISAPITNGSSGGALLDKSGNLAGITQGGYRPDDNTENVNSAVKSIMIIALAQGESDCQLMVGDDSEIILFNSLENSVLPLKIYEN